MSRADVLVVDDDSGIRDGLARLLQKWGYAVRTASSAEEALGVAEGCAIVITDLVLPQMDGIELLQQLKEMARPPVSPILTAHGTLTTAVESMRQGAFYYLTKPVDPVQLQVLLEKSLEQASLTRELSLLRHQLKQKGTFGKLTGESKDMQEAYRWIELAATSGAPVLVYGESGTGKELVARTIHERSNRRQGPFVAINCAAIPETLIESEIFGHERGAFTGAIERRLGCFELADRGTLFLDEIAEMEVSVQAKLLRILQDNAVQRAVVPGEGALLTAEHLSPAILATSRPTPTAAAPRTGERIRDMERRLIVETLEHVNHDKTRAAVLLGISPKTLYNKIARYKIRSVKRSDAT